MLCSIRFLCSVTSTLTLFAQESFGAELFPHFLSGQGTEQGLSVQEYPPIRI